MTELNDHIRALLNAADDRGLNLILLDMELPARVRFWPNDSAKGRGYLEITHEYDILGELERLVPIRPSA